MIVLFRAKLSNYENYGTMSLHSRKNMIIDKVLTTNGHFHSFENSSIFVAFTLNKKGKESNPFSQLSILSIVAQMTNSNRTKHSP